MAQENGKNTEVVEQVELVDKKTLKDRVNEHPMAAGVGMGILGTAAAYGAYRLIKHFIVGSDDDDEDSDSESDSFGSEE